MSTGDPFIYIWAYRVSPEKVDEFQRLYGPNGPWVHLFRQAPGYLGTDLYRDRDDRGRFLTLDRWETEDAFTRFRVTFADEFRRLDGDGQRLTLDETHLGDFVLQSFDDGAGDPEPDTPS